MPHTTTSQEAGAPLDGPGFWAVFHIWWRHLASLAIPSTALLFLWTGPHPWYVAPLFVLPVGALLFLDRASPDEKRQPQETLPAWPFDALVYALAGLQFLIVFELARMFATQDIFSMDMAMVVLVVGGNSGFSIITAHELIHRSKRWEQGLGRLLLCTVLYEHFFTEHLRGHHLRVATEQDPATAHFGETYSEFWRRTVPGQFRSAWALEAKRLGDEQMGLFDRRMLRNRILHGLGVGWGLAFAIFLVFGAAALVAHLLQAFLAVRLLEAVNYFEHWGLQRKSRRVRPQDSWDTHSRFTYYGLTGLSRHADHHAYPRRPYQQLRVWEEAPILPMGYVGLVDQVLIDSNAFIESAVEELRRRKLGPYADDATPEETARLEAYDRAKAAASTAGEATPQGLARLLAPVPAALRPVVFWVFVVVALTVGGWVEAGSMGTASFGPMLLTNLTILAVLAGAIATQRLVARTTGREGLAWLPAFGVVAGVGALIHPMLG
jgi:alkane 1-monooxygenase